MNRYWVNWINEDDESCSSLLTEEEIKKMKENLDIDILEVSKEPYKD